MSKNINFEAVIFDLDGTLIDSMGLWREVDKVFLSKRGFDIPDDLFDHLPEGNSYLQTAIYFKNRFHLSETVESIMEEWTQYVRKFYQELLPLKYGVLEVLEFIRKNNLKIGLGTSNSKDLTIAVLDRHKLLPYFESVVTGCQTIKGKPFPDIYLQVASELNVSPTKCIVIEDTLSGIRAAKNAGMYAISIFDEDSIKQRDLIEMESDFSALDYDHVLQHLKELFQ